MHATSGWRQFESSTQVVGGVGGAPHVDGHASLLTHTPELQSSELKHGSPSTPEPEAYARHRPISWSERASAQSRTAPGISVRRPFAMAMTTFATSPPTVELPLQKDASISSVAPSAAGTRTAEKQTPLKSAFASCVLEQAAMVQS